MYRFPHICPCGLESALLVAMQAAQLTSAKPTPRSGGTALESGIRSPSACPLATRAAHACFSDTSSAWACDHVITIKGMDVNM